MRLDSDYWKKKYRRFFKCFDRLNCTPITEQAIIQDGNHMSIGEHFTDVGIPYFRGTDMRNFFIDVDATPLCIPQSVYQSSYLKRSHLLPSDVLISIVGTIGNVAMVTRNQEATCNCKLAILRANNQLRPEYIAAFFACKYGQWQIERNIRGSIQKGLILEDFEQLTIPVIDAEEQFKVAKIVERSRYALTTAISLYSSAENYLLECLGMQDFAANPGTYSVKTLKESFLESGRIDAEFYLPKYEDYVNAVLAYAGGVAPLGDVCAIKDSNYTPEHGEKYRYIELANIGKSGEIMGCTCEKGEELPTRARRIVTQGDVIVSSIEGSLSSCALVTEDYDHALCSTGFYVVRSAHINSETLLTLFKSFPVQQLLKKGCSGTILTGISKQEFEGIPIPLIRHEVQEEIAKQIRQSFTLRKEAAELLENAKLSVEHVIENGGGING